LRPDLRCGICTFKWTYERALLEGAEAASVAASLASLIEQRLEADLNLGVLNTEAVKKAYEFVNFTSPYFSPFKRSSNENAKALLHEARAYIEAAKEERGLIERAVKVACASNVSPVTGPRRPYSFEETMRIVKGEKGVRVAGEILSAILQARSILYLPDNAGEIAFDGLLIDALTRMGKEVHVFVKKAPFFDDATREDAEELGIRDAVKSLHEIDGFLFPPALEGGAREVFLRSDLILSKGIGNYHAIGEEDLGRPVIHMFKVKCLPISRRTAGDLGELRIIMEG
jgi:uncharacterized protein with ATP-grasp and redox domains